jgi:AraC family transcriptional regulator
MPMRNGASVIRRTAPKETHPMSFIASNPQHAMRALEPVALTAIDRLPLHPRRAADQPARRCMLADWQLKRIERHIEEHLGERVPCAALASMVRLSTSHFGRAFRATTGRTPHAYVMARRMARAKILMRETAMPLSEIALECGMADQSHFSRVFSALEGISPGVWRRVANGRRAA